MNFGSYFIDNYIVIITIVGMCVFFATGQGVNKKMEHTLCITLAIVLCSTIVKHLELQTAALPYFTKERILYSAIGYSMYPFAVLYMIKMVNKIEKHFFLVCIPAIVNALFAFSAFFTDISYSYTPDNEFVRGPLGYMPHIVCCFYMFVLLMTTMRIFASRKYMEGLILVYDMVICVGALAIETLTDVENLINGSVAVSVCFYYLYYHSQTHKRDALTGLLNRISFYNDSEKGFSGVSAVISIDMNELKWINDNKGHDAGDRALKAISECFVRLMTKNTRAYRMGGDEFLVLCYNMEETQVIDLQRRIRQSVEDTGYSCAYGIAMQNGDMDMNGLCRVADEEMYRNKEAVKREMFESGREFHGRD